MSKRKKLIDKLREKYKLVILNDDTFEEKASFNASLWYLIIGAATFAILLIILTITAIRFTPLREYLSVTDATSKKEIIDAYSKVDSLEMLADANKIYLNNLKNIINGKVPETGKTKPVDDKSKATDSIKLNQKISKEERELRKLIESEGKFDLNASDNRTEKSGIASYSFFSPLRGKITDEFDSKIQHYGIDITSRQNESIKATLDGTIFFSNFTSETGYVIAIQHSNNLVSIYKHCSVLLKKVGSFVRAGEVIAIVGNSGEFTTGPHLHFELWFNGTAVNPKNYMTF